MEGRSWVKPVRTEAPMKRGRTGKQKVYVGGGRRGKTVLMKFEGTE